MAPRISRDVLRGEIPHARQALVATLRRLTPEQWDAPSLCEAWRVRDVVAHLVHEFRLYRFAPRLVPGFVRSGLRVNRFLAVEAQRLGSDLGPQELTEQLEAARFEDTRCWKLYPWPQFALTEFVIHAQDIRRPLGITDAPSPSQVKIAADVFARPAGLDPFMTKLPAVRFEATDQAWTYGAGPTVRGPLEAIVMVLAGRSYALRDVDGEGVALVESALRPHAVEK